MQTPTLLFDIGNSRLKWAMLDMARNPDELDKKIWEYSGVIDTKLLGSELHRKELSHYLLNTVPKPKLIGLCCVASERRIDDLKQILHEWKDLPIHRLMGSSSFPNLRSQYLDKHLLGADRWASIIAARNLSQENCLVVNCGTATTIDLLGSNGIHYGGWIIPGMRLMQDSLIENTARLDLPENKNSALDIGLNTSMAISSGCLLAQIGALQSALNYAESKRIKINRLWIDGGDADLLLPHLSVLPITSEKITGLVLRGLWAWLKSESYPKALSSNDHE